LVIGICNDQIDPLGLELQRTDQISATSAQPDQLDSDRNVGVKRKCCWLHRHPCVFGDQR